MSEIKRVNKDNFWAKAEVSAAASLQQPGTGEWDEALGWSSEGDSDESSPPTTTTISNRGSSRPAAALG